MFLYLRMHEWIIGLAGVLLLILGVLGYGRWEHHKGVAEILRKDKSAAIIAKAKGEAVTAQVVTRYITRVQVIHDAGATIIKKVPIYVSHKDNLQCVVGTGFVQLWGAANTLSIPNTSEGVNDTASGITISAVAEEHVREANLFNQQRAQLLGLQEWVRGQQALGK